MTMAHTLSWLPLFKASCTRNLAILFFLFSSAFLIMSTSSPSFMAQSDILSLFAYRVFNVLV